MDQKTLNSANLRSSFLWAFISSAGLMIIIKVFNLHSFVLIIAPIIIMFFYYRSFANAINKETFRNQFADSFYSLGFLLTLMSLVVTFIPFFLNGGSVTMQQTLGNFGVALFTTLIGLTVRIYLTSFTLGLEEMQKEAVCQLENDVRLFKKEMESSIKVMHEFNDKLEKTTNQTVEDFGMSLAGAGKEITDLVQGTMAEAVKPLSRTFADLAKEVEEGTQGFGKELDESFKNCVNSVNAIRLEPDLLSRTITPVVNDFNHAADGIKQSIHTISSSLNSSSGTLDSAMNNFSSSIGALNENLLKSLHNLVDKLERMEIDPAVFNHMLQTSFTEFKKAVDEVAEHTKTHGMALLGGARAIEKTMPAYDKVAENLQHVLSFNGELTKPIEQISALAAKVEDLSKSLNDLEQRTNQYTQSIGSSVSLYANSSQDLEKHSQGISAIRSDLERQLGAATNDIKMLGAAFSDIAGFVATKLGPKTEEA